MEWQTYLLEIRIKITSFDDDGVVELPGGTVWTFSIAAADVNNDRIVDILIGNFGGDSGYDGTNKLLINRGGNISFDHPIDLPGGDTVSTRSIVAAVHVNNDGMVDILIGNTGKVSNQLLMNSGNGNLTIQLVSPLVSWTLDLYPSVTDQ